jgi:hypothetical protein
MKILVSSLGEFLIAALMGGQTLNATTSCEGLASLTLPDTTITRAEVVPAGAFSRSAVGRGSAGQAFSNPVPFCRVAATLKPSSDSDIKIEVWLPVSGWNGKFQAVGNGGSWRRVGNDRCSAALHGARHGPLRRRRGPEHIRHNQRARAMGRARQGARRDHCVSRDERRRRSNAAALSIPPARDVQGNRKHGRSGQLRLQSAVGSRRGEPTQVDSRAGVATPQPYRASA